MDTEYNAVSTHFLYCAESFENTVQIQDESENIIKTDQRTKDTFVEIINQDTEDPLAKEQNDDYNIISNQAYFELNERENKIREQKYKTGNLRVQYTKIHCTACNQHLGSALSNLPNIFVHPLLNVLLCKECYKFYQSGDFEKDSDGSEFYCRWCGQGGKVVCCSICSMVFCVSCIKQNFSYSKYLEIKTNDEWKCYACYPKQIIDLRVHCFEFRDYAITQLHSNSRELVKEFGELFKQLDFTTCCINKGKKRKVIISTDLLHGNFASNVALTESKRIKAPPKKLPESNEITTVPVLIPKRNPFYIGPLKNARIDDGFISRYPYDAADPRKAHNEQQSSIQHISFVGTSKDINTTGDIQSIPNLINQVPQYLPTIYLPSQFSNNVSYKPIQVHFRPIQPKLNTTFETNDTFYHSYSSHASRNTTETISSSNSDKISFLSKHRLIEKTLCSAALANSTFASTMLKLNQLELADHYSSDHVPVYNALQESLSAAIKSLMQIQKQLDGWNDGSELRETNRFQARNLRFPSIQNKPLKKIIITEKENRFSPDMIKTLSK